MAHTKNTHSSKKAKTPTNKIQTSKIPTIKIKVGILGASGYTANELVRLLISHPNADIIWLGSQSFEGQSYFKAYQNFFEILPTKCVNGENLAKLAKQIDVLFCATPHNFCAKILDDGILDSTKVVDLSADFRLKNPSVFQQWYHSAHSNQKLLKEAIYGLCELNRNSIKSARLIANPGCYPTCSILALAPLLSEKKSSKSGPKIDISSIIIDAKSGVSGAGRSAKMDNLFCEVVENFKAYGVASHRHTPEIEQAISTLAGQNITLSFTPHLVPMNRGIFASIYATPSADFGRELQNAKSSKKDSAKNLLTQVYKDFYAGEKFVRILEEDMSVQTRWVEGSNFVDIAPYFDFRTNRIIITAALDNLIKGAAGQAVQNMNIAFGIDETSGLESTPIFP
mgnify:CR=1 FL=1